MEEKILSKHPDKNKRGVKISRKKYELLNEAILLSLKEKGELTHTNLEEQVSKRVKGQFEGSISWYMETVKLDLEARGVIERVKAGGREVYRAV